MISVTQLRNGTTFEDGGQLYKVLKYEHTHLSRGAGTIKVKARNLRNGNVLNLAYKSGAMVEEIAVERKALQYLYRDGEDLVFMDPKSFEQVTVAAQILGPQAHFLKENEEIGVFFWGQEALDVDLPLKVTLKIVEAAPGVKGDTAANVYKTAKLENGLTIKVPLFVEAGELVRVDTRNGEYIERA